MPRVVNRVPELSEVLCSSCGYVLNGLPETGACPECGQPISASLDTNRHPPEWETADRHHRQAAFIRTSGKIIFAPKSFYRTLNVRGPVEGARSFARIHWLIASVLFGAAAAVHAVWFSYLVSPWLSNLPGGKLPITAAVTILLSAMSFGCLDLITRLAAKLTNLEATYRGIRLPYDIVLRGMYYHAAHYLPVGLVAFDYVAGFQLILQWFGQLTMIYLYALCGLVVLCAVYLFQTYWIGMRNMMYANK